jgi:pilus assembly protein CpaB
LNPRQRRGVLLIILAMAGAVAVFVSVSSYVADVRSEVGDKIPVLRLTQPVPIDQPIPDSALEQVLIPQRWVSSTALPPGWDLTGQVAATELVAGSYLDQGMLKPAPDIRTGEREIAILVDYETGVDLKIFPGSFVDVLATFAGEETTGEDPCVAVVVPGARIIEVGPPGTKPAPNQTGQFTEQQVIPVTFGLRPIYARRLVLAESFATHVRLAQLRQDELSQLAASKDCGPSLLADKAPASSGAGGN